MKNEIQTSIGLLRIRLADAKDKHAVSAIMRDAASWLKAKGIDQWQSVFKEGFEPAVERWLLAGVVYVAWLDEEPVATVRIVWVDPIFWGQRGRDGLAGYIHGLAIARKYAGKGVGKDILAWACELIQTKDKVIRLDCAADNQRLCQFYEALGFTYMGDSPPSEHSKTRLYEYVDEKNSRFDRLD